MNQEIRSDELNLLQLFNVLRRYKRLLVGLPLVGAILASLLVSFVLRPTWEATAVLEVGRIAQATPTAAVPVEPIANVLSRMIQPSFAKGALNFSGIKPDEFKTVQGFYNTLKVTQVKGSELVEITLRGPSEEMANNLIRGAIVYLQKTHNEMMAVTVERYKKQDQILIEDIKNLSDETKLLKQKLLASHNWNAFDANLAATVLKDNTNQLSSMIQNKLALEEQLNPSRTYTTRLIDDVNVSEGPVSPKKGLIIGLAILLGLFGAVVIAFTHNAMTSKSA